MSDENSFGTVTTQAPPSEAPVEEAAGRNSKALLVAGAVAVVVLAVFAYLLFFKSGSSDTADQGVVPKPVPTSHATKDTSKNSGKSKDNSKDSSKSETKSQDVQGRDPFEPLQVATTTTGTDTSTGSGSTTTGGTTTAAMVTVGLTAVNKDTVNTTVDGKAYKGIGEGETFATNFQVYAIFNDSCAGFLYGDESFVLCENKSVSLTKLGG